MCYNSYVFQISTRIMYEPSFQDYESNYEYGDLDEMYDESYASSLEDLDEDMYRDHESYENLAYRHYA